MNPTPRLKCSNAACVWVGPEAQGFRVLAFCCPSCRLTNVLLSEGVTDYWAIVPNTASFTLKQTPVPA